MKSTYTNIALIGSGNMAAEHARAFEAIPNTKITVVCSRNLAKARKLAIELGGTAFTDQVRDIKNYAKIDLIIVAVSIEATFKLIVEVLKLEIPLLVEKPLGFDLEQCENIHKILELSSIKAWVGLNRRCYSSTINALKYLKDDTNQRIVDIFDQQDKLSANTSKFHPSVVKNWMFANSIHLIDYAYIFGRGIIEKVSVMTGWNLSHKHNVVSAKMQFSSGDLVYYRALWGMPGPWLCAITTKKIRLEMSPLENLKVQESGSRQKTSVKLSSIDKDFKAGLMFQAKEIIEEIVKKRPTKFVPNSMQALNTTRLVAKIYEM